MALKQGMGEDAEDPDKTVVSAALPRAHPPPVDDDATVIQPVTAPLRAAAPPAPPSRRPPLPAQGTAALALQPGFRLHEYRIDKVLGQGGFGITYLATDVNLNSRVAIKEYLPEEIAFRKSGQTVSAHSSRHRDRYKSGLDSFLIEGRTLASFRHPNIVRVARFFEAHQTAYMVLEYERGSPLKEWWPRHAEKTSEQDLALLLQPLLDGLSVVHAAGFLHRDIKPDNIQVRRSDGSLVLLDFGSARQAVGSSAGGEQADVAVTPCYAPIEQYQDGEQGAWTDIYAMGATLYWMVSGKKPVDAMERLAATMAGAADPLQPVAEVAPAGRYGASFLAAIDWALKLQPGERPQDVAGWRARLFAAHASSLGLQEALRAGDLLEGAPALGAQLGRRLLHGLQRLLAPGSWPLALKLGLIMALAALLPMGITGYYNLQSSIAKVSEAELSNLQLLARSTAGRMAQLISDSQNLARALGTDGDFVDFLAGLPGHDREGLRAKMQALVASNPDIHLMMLMDAGGTAVVSSDAEVQGRNFAFREYFKSAMRGQPHTTGIVVGAVAGAAGMFYAYPVFAPQSQRPIGAIVLRIRASSFDTILKDVDTSAELSSFLIDGDGVLIGHPDPKALYSSLAPLPPARLAEIRADQRFRRDQIRSLDMPDLAAAMVGANAQGHISYRSTLSGADEIAGFAPVRGSGDSGRWVVGVSESREVFEALLECPVPPPAVERGPGGPAFLWPGPAAGPPHRAADPGPDPSRRRAEDRRLREGHRQGGKPRRGRPADPHLQCADRRAAPARTRAPARRAAPGA